MHRKSLILSIKACLKIWFVTKYFFSSIMRTHKEDKQNSEIHRKEIKKKRTKFKCSVTTDTFMLYKTWNRNKELNQKKIYHPKWILGKVYIYTFCKYWTYLLYSLSCIFATHFMVNRQEIIKYFNCSRVTS